MTIECADVIAILDGQNGGFKSYMRCEEVNRIDSIGGLSQVEEVHFYETSDRPIPNRLKDGEAVVMDVLVKMEPNISVCLN